MKTVLKRYEKNPILRPVPGSWWEGCQTRNPSAILHDGKVYMFYTATGDIKHEHTIYLGLAVSSDGYNFARVSDLPYISPDPEMFDGFDAGGVEDSRIVKIGDTFYMTYMARAIGYVAFERGKRVQSPPSNGGTWTKNFRRGGLLCSKDLKTWERKGPLTPDNIFEANVCLFPEKINGRFVLLHRPSADIPFASAKAGMSIAFSDNLKDWVEDKPLLQAHGGWEEKVGGSAPPIKTDKGWLTLYHGVEYTIPGREDEKEWYSPYFAHGNHFYRTGVMLLDLKDPSKIIARCPSPILEPEECYEKWGTVFNVVFPCGMVDMNGTLFIYYGGADTVCNVATVGLNELLDFVLQFPCK
jgi:predicted GH43/DUF377 family glycosyl hydrolase